MGRTLDAYKKLFDSVRAGKVAPVYFLYGSEEFLRREFLRELLDAALPEENRSFNLDIFHGDEFDRTRFDDRMSSFPLFADRRVIIVKRFDVLALSSRDAVIEAVRGVTTGTVLVVESELDRLDTARHRNLDAAARECGVSFHCAPVTPDEAVLRLRARFRRDGCEITPDALETLVASAGVRLIDLANEAEKIMLLVGSDTKITPAHVRSVVGSYRTESLFAVLDAFGHRGPAHIVRGVERLLDGGEEPVFVLAMLQRRVAQLLEISELQGAGLRRARDIAARLGSGLRGFQVEKLARVAANGTPERFGILLDNLRWADRMLKSSVVPARTLIRTALVSGYAGRVFRADAA